MNECPPLIIIQLLVHQRNRIYQEIEQCKEMGSTKLIPTLYLHIPFFSMADKLYDFLLTDGHTIDFPEPDKQEMWKASIKQLKGHTHKAKWDKEMLKTERIKVYKSMLVKKYLIDKYMETGEKLQLHDQHGNPIKELKLVGREKRT